MIEQAINLYEFCQDKEMRWNGLESLMLWLSFDDIPRFIDVVGDAWFYGENNVMVNLQEDCICIDLFELLGNDLELETIFKGENCWGEYFG